MILRKEHFSEKILYLISFLASVLFILTGFPVVSCVIYGCVALYLAWHNNENTIIGFLILAVLQNIMLIIFADKITPTYNTIISLIKEFLIYGAAVVGIMLYLRQYGIESFFHKYKGILVLFLLFIMIILKNTIASDAKIMSIFVTLRQIAIPFACFLCGYFLTIKYNGIKKIIMYVIIIASLLTIIGIVDMMLPNNMLWNMVDYGKYLQNKQNGIISLYEGVTRNFYTWDLGFMMRRLVSITADPLATAHLICMGFMAFVILCSKPWQKALNKALLFLLLLGCLLGFSKGTVVYIMILIVAVFYDKYYYKINKKIGMTVIIAITVVFTAFITFSYISADKPTAITNHINGLLSGLENATLWGNGIGTSGAVNSAVTGAAVNNTESYFGVILNQVGWCGIAIIVSIWFRLLFKNIRYYLLDRCKETLFSIILIIGLSIDMLLSESSVSITGTGIYFIIIGMLYKFSTRKEECYE